MDIQDLLPIGSIVLLKDGEKRLMISGIKQINQKRKWKAGKEYDYIAVLYPEGYIGEGCQYLFNHEDIAQVFFRGYEDKERDSFVKKLSDLYRNKK